MTDPQDKPLTDEDLESLLRFTCMTTCSDRERMALLDKLSEGTVRLIRDLREARREADTAKQAVGALRFCAKHKQHLSPLECERLADIIEEAARSKT
jgi:hypothetical protein